MSLRKYEPLRRIPSLLPRILRGNHLWRSRQPLARAVPSSVLGHQQCDDRIKQTSIWKNGFHFHRYSTTSELSTESPPSPPPLVNELLSFIMSSMDKLQGPHHCWINTADGSKDIFNTDGTFLVLAGRFLEDFQIIAMIEKVKLLQQRFPQLCVMGFHSGSSACSADDQTRLVELIMKEYITFPILLCNKDFLEIENGGCYILSKGSWNPLIYHGKGLDIEMLKRAVEELYVQEKQDKRNLENMSDPGFHKFKSTWWKQAEAIKGPYFCSPLQNLFLHFPGCVSADESGNRIFLSDSNHHRIIICDGNGELLDCIGSCPGFEDGEFESAKLMRPAASFYDDTEDCLYIVDSENHAIRRADLEKRVLETLYPTCSVGKKMDSLWIWLVNNLGFLRSADAKSEESDSSALVFPWHLLKSDDDTLLIISRSFENLWTMDMASGKIIDSIRGYPKILETCGQFIMRKLSVLKQLPSDCFIKQSDAIYSPKGLPCANLISSFTTLENHVVMSDTAAQGILKLSRESGSCSGFQFSNFGVLGVPYWASSSLECVYSSSMHCGAWTDHLECFRLLPGRITMQLNINIPADTELVEPLQEECIWRQARGSATDVLGAESASGSSEKVGAAQQWYDELDNLAFTTPESEITVEDDDTTTDVKSQDYRIRFDCVVNTSPGTSEVIIHAAIYLKLRRQPDTKEDSQEKYAARIVDILNPGRSGGLGKDSCVQFLSRSNRDLRDLIFMKPLHVRIKLDCLNHPKSDNSRDVILTDSSIDVNVSLGTRLGLAYKTGVMYSFATNLFCKVQEFDFSCL